MRIGVFGKRPSSGMTLVSPGVAVLQVWLLVFGFVAVSYGVGLVSGEKSICWNGETVSSPSECPPYEKISESEGAGGGAKENMGDKEAGDSGGAESGLLSLIQYPFGIGEKGAEGWKIVGGRADALVTGLQWAGIAYMGGQLLGGMFGFSDVNTEALSTALAAGVGVYRALETYAFTGKGAIIGKEGFLSVNPGAVGLAIGVIVFIAMYKDVETKVVTFDCMPWQAPTGGNSCEVCNDENLPCSEYRCKSLGQGCEIVNSGTADEKCVYVNPRDVSPPIIRPNYAELSTGHEYRNVRSSPPGPGFEIVNLGSSDGCLRAFTSLEFGLTIDEPAQCKIDFEHRESFEEMVAYVGGNNLYLYNHSEVFSLPGASELMGSGFVLENGKDLTFFLRCRDKNGNENSAEYAVNFCVDPSPDTTPPKIEATSIMNG